MQQQQRQQQQEAAAAEAAVQDAYVCVIDLAMYLPLGRMSGMICLYLTRWWSGTVVLQKLWVCERLVLPHQQLKTGTLSAPPASRSSSSSSKCSCKVLMGWGARGRTAGTACSVACSTAGAVYVS
jgi:hypothetical protein